MKLNLQRCNINDIFKRQFILLQITNVESQVVAGVKYTVTLILAMTNCKKGIESEKLEICEENTSK